MEISIFDTRDPLARLKSVNAFVLDIFQDAGKAQAFLDRPHAMLDNKAPCDLAAASPAGAKAVINLLGRAAFSGGV